ncbi:ankyrin repeat domain-containing protein [Microbulbifer sp. TRSA002]|uniref:ankyrin repeat domain-containing protein n=1 Tax=Microbulbifer sp. TRSA002 TaxID=3243382 RepID=UPI00403A1A1D
MRRHDEVDRQKSQDFDILLDAVLNEPHKVNDIVTGNRECLRAVNYSGENVLHWLAVENHTEGVQLLRSLGSPIPEFALIHALEAGHTEMVILLLELGADPNIEACKRSLNNSLWVLSDKTKRLIRSYFKQYGHEI